MKKVTALLFILNVNLSFGQKEFHDFERYKDCQIDIPIRHGKSNQESDRLIAQQLSGTEIIVIDTKNDGQIKRFNRGYIGIYEKTDAMATYFEPTESVISFDRKYAVYLLYNNKNTYCYDAICYDQKNGIEQNEEEVICDTQNQLASQYYGNGVIALEYEKYDLAIRWFEESIKKDSTFCDAWNNVGVAHRLAGNFEKSYWSFMNSIYHDSTNHYGWINLYSLFMLNQDTAYAVRSLENLIKYAPKKAIGYEELSGHYERVGDAKMEEEIKVQARKNGIVIQ